MSSPTPESRDQLHHLTLGMMRYLRHHPSVTDIKLHEKMPAQKHQLLTWEQQNACIVPEDLKHFYRTADGLKVEWSVTLEGNVMPVGCLEVNPISRLTRVCAPTNATTAISVLDVMDSDDEDESAGDGLRGDMADPKLTSSWKVFELDACKGHGKACLVYRVAGSGAQATSPSVWFLDRSLVFHFIAATFTEYFRLLVAHLGLPLWQFALTPMGLPPPALQWINMYSPLRLGMDTTAAGGGDQVPETRNNLDIGRVFKGKTAVKKPVATSQPQSTTATSTGAGRGRRVWPSSNMGRNLGLSRPSLNSR